jgi:L-lactate permease
VKTPSLDSPLFFPSFLIPVLLIPHYDRLRRIEIVKTIEQGILGSFIGMLGLVLYNFRGAAFVDISSVLFTIAAFLALLKNVGLPYIPDNRSSPLHSRFRFSQVNPFTNSSGALNPTGIF